MKRKLTTLLIVIGMLLPFGAAPAQATSPCGHAYGFSNLHYSAPWYHVVHKWKDFAVHPSWADYTIRAKEWDYDWVGPNDIRLVNITNHHCGYGGSA